MSAIKIIAEAGINHNGSLDIAKEMVEVAAMCGVNIICFQETWSESLMSLTYAEHLSQ